MASQQPSNRRPEGLAPGAHVTAPVLHASIWPRQGPSDRFGTGLGTLRGSLRPPAFQLLLFLQVHRSPVQGSHCSSLLPLAALAGASRRPDQGASPLPGQVMHSTRSALQYKRHCMAASCWPCLSAGQATSALPHQSLSPCRLPRRACTPRIWLGCNARRHETRAG